MIAGGPIKPKFKVLAFPEVLRELSKFKEGLLLFDAKLLEDNTEEVLLSILSVADDPTFTDILDRFDIFGRAGRAGGPGGPVFKSWGIILLTLPAKVDELRADRPVVLRSVSGTGFGWPDPTTESIKLFGKVSGNL